MKKFLGVLCATFLVFSLVAITNADTITELIKVINPGCSASISPDRLTNVDGTLFFRADDGTHGWELWKSDGTPAGTELVKEIRPDSDGSSPESLTNVDGTLFFTADDGTHGRELWKSDGTPAGTELVKEIHPGSAHSSLFDLTNVDGTLFFTADDGTHGFQLWKTYTSIPGDLDGDGNIDADDINLVMSLIISGDYDPDADINGDGVVNVLDARQLAMMCTNENCAP